MTISRKDFNVTDCKGEYVLKGGEYWDIKSSKPVKGDILIEGGIIKEIGRLESAGGTVIDISGKVVFPGLMDMHVHFREPGREDKETIESGSQAACAGGFTAACPMPNTAPVIDNREMVSYILEKSKDLIADVYPVGALTKELKGGEISEIADMVNAGAVAISDDGVSTMDLDVMRRGMEYISMYDVPLLAHCEENDLSAGGVMHEGYYSTKLGLPGIPSISEEAAVMRNIMIAEYTGCRLHVCHVSTSRSIELIKQAKDSGIKVTCEVTPHHLTLTDKCIESYDPNFKMNPPLRTEKDVESLREGLKSGIIDVIATDHAPHTIEEKEWEFDRSPFGVTGLETAFGVIHKYLIETDIISIEQMVDFFIINPRKILNIEIPLIEKNKGANLIIVEPHKKWVVDKSGFYSRSLNSSYLGEELTVEVQGVFNNNKVWMK